MYKINNTTVDGEMFIVNITILLGDKQDVELVASVPVKFPKSKAEVIAAIEARVKAEQIKYATEPILTAVKNEIDAMIEANE